MMFSRDAKQARIDTLIGKAAHIHGDIEFLILKPDHWFHRANILPLLD